MFSGIVEEMGTVLEVLPGRLAVAGEKALSDARTGDSLSVNGACLTIAELRPGVAAFDLMPETLRRTGLGQLKPGDSINLERALAFNGRVGGHLVQGHVDARGKVLSREAEGGALLLRFRAPKTLLRYLVEKGFIAIDGVSLTIVMVEGDTFTVSLVEYTQQVTTLGRLQPGDSVNLEVDILAKYVERLLAEAPEVLKAKAGGGESSHARD